MRHHQKAAAVVSLTLNKSRLQNKPRAPNKTTMSIHQSGCPTHGGDVHASDTTSQTGGRYRHDRPTTS
ncbi:hypothetical protein RHGRI_025969 [Rhododendron griersonianum]|uniref:Uncharacterized protein n=1 Tax=Rhododendron griersonianum TaxID=479676 RepID=A0AAV6IRW7_9ERIC|nr:hypothetical protein RHGRI_025969 [Rhododendron griersonianum]